MLLHHGEMGDWMGVEVVDLCYDRKEQMHKPRILTERMGNLNDV